jgi:hypothetical protein
MDENDIKVLELSLRVLTREFDKFISECQDDNGALKAPSRQAMMRARGMLPAWCSNTLIRRKQ